MYRRNKYMVIMETMEKTNPVTEWDELKMKTDFRAFISVS